MYLYVHIMDTKKKNRWKPSGKIRAGYLWADRLPRKYSQYVHMYMRTYMNIGKKKPPKAERRNSRRMSLMSWLMPPKVVSI